MKTRTGRIATWILLRLWLAPPNSRALPPGFEDALGHDGAWRAARRHRPTTGKGKKNK